MAKLVVTVDIPNEAFDPEHYAPLENPTAVEMIQYDIAQVETGRSSAIELLDSYLEYTTKDPVLEAKP